jgi:hypothetical protein
VRGLRSTRASRLGSGSELCPVCLSVSVGIGRESARATTFLRILFGRNPRGELGLIDCGSSLLMDSPNQLPTSPPGVPCVCVCCSLGSVEPRRA